MVLKAKRTRRGPPSDSSFFVCSFGWLAAHVPRGIFLPTQGTTASLRRNNSHALCGAALLCLPCLLLPSRLTFTSESRRSWGRRMTSGSSRATVMFSSLGTKNTPPEIMFRSLRKNTTPPGSSSMSRIGFLLAMRLGTGMCMAQRREEVSRRGVQLRGRGLQFENAGAVPVSERSCRNLVELAPQRGAGDFRT